MPTTTEPASTPLASTLRRALTADDTGALSELGGALPSGPRDRFATLLAIYELHTAPLPLVGDAARHQHHPVVAALKQRCEQDWLDELTELALPDAVAAALDGEGPIQAMRALAARDRLPAVYKWLARQADREQLVEFLALEGGPDAGFDDLVAACQIGLFGAPKMELATNYWDELGNGDPAAVHTTLHDQLVEAIDMPRIDPDQQPVSALARSAFGGLLATNRWLQPEMLGALGLIELQAGPRCRLVLQALDRCNAPAATLPFYAVHAEVDPRHGKDWLDKAITPTVADHPDWGARIVRGAHWRAAVNAAFLDDLGERFGVLSKPRGSVPTPDTEAAA
jgi:hypothetical protein